MKKARVIKAFCDFLESQGLSRTSIKGYSQIAINWLDLMDQNGIDPRIAKYSDVLLFINEQQKKGLKARTINGKLRAIKWYYKHLQQTDRSIINPVIDIQMKGVIRKIAHDIVDYEDLEKLYENYPVASPIGKRNKVICGLLIYQGLSNGEIAKLRIENIDLEAACIEVAASRRSNQRRLKLKAVQIKGLDNYIHQVRPAILVMRQTASERLIISTGKSEGINNVLTQVMRVLKRMNESIKNAKQIRASVITYWLSKYNMRQVQYMAGHRYVSSTQHYKVDYLKTLKEGLDKYHPLG